MVEKVTGKKVPVTDSARRPGDPPVLVADASRARVELGWSPRYSSLEQIIKSAWYWHHTVMPVAGLRQITSRFAPSTRDVAEPVRE
jgi:UDP-glucose 4-epimerase